MLDGLPVFLSLGHWRAFPRLASDPATHETTTHRIRRASHACHPERFYSIDRQTHDREYNEEMVQTLHDVPRLLPPVELPAYTFTPGSSLPHPFRHPDGHSHHKKGAMPKPLSDESWADNRSFLLAIDLFNAGYYWEAHDELDKLWRVAGPDTLVGRFLKGLFKLSAAGMKVREDSIHGVRRHAASSGEVFADVAAEIDGDRFCGLKLTMLQFAADRAAQLTYKQALPEGEPIRVFPFVLRPEPMPLG